MKSKRGPRITLFALLTMLVVTTSWVALEARMPLVTSVAGDIRFNSVPAIPAVKVGFSVLADQVGDAIVRFDRNVLQSDSDRMERDAFASASAIELPRACDRLSAVETKQLRAGFSLMRVTAEGIALHDQLLEYDVCIDVQSLSYNGGYMDPGGTSRNRWRGTKIVVDDQFMRPGMEPFIAMVLVHESAHFERIQSQTHCAFSESCTFLANDVAVEEEVYASSTEARWLIEAYGLEGMRERFDDWPSVSEKVRAYQAGDEAMRDYIVETRSDPREGEGIGLIIERLAA